MRLPEEELVREDIAAHLIYEFSLASDLLSLATSIVMHSRPGKNSRGVDPVVLGVAFGLLSKACKQFRAVGELVRIGLGDVAQSNCRMLFETMLAVHFVLRHRVTLRTGNVLLPTVRGRTLTTRFRTNLYLANEAFNCHKLERCIKDTPGIRRKVSRQNLDAAGWLASAWEKQIGPEWSKRVRERGYAGVSVENLARSLGYATIYATVYRMSSAGVHATNATKFAYIDETGGDAVCVSVSPDTEGVVLALAFATTALLQILQQFEFRLCFGIGESLLKIEKRARQATRDLPGF